ncbi:MAG: M20 family metallopeptidase [Cytophagales bacterium]|nr:M20 family metallopeptidase [Cytophagales bacterium]
MTDKIKSIAQSIHQEVVDIRRHIHAHPELSFAEYDTAAYIENMLKLIGITNIERKAGTGVVAHILGKKGAGKTIALRADIDALPITESNDTIYKSKNVGVMHACGHDVHSASLLGAAMILHRVAEEYSGTIRLIFQPGEEKAPGGASLLIQEGVLQNPTPASIIGQHVMPQLQVGKVGFREGIYMASADEIYMTVKGKGGHAAMPDSNVDPVVIASHIIIAMQQVVSRMANPKIPTVVSFGKVIANGATNVIPNEVYIEGTFRTLDENWRADAKIKMQKMAEAIAHGMGAEIDFRFMTGYPYLANAPELTRRLKQRAEMYMGNENVIDLDIWMASEDFAFYSQEIDACFYRLGVRNDAKGITSPVHTPTFDIDENALETGSGLMAYMALCELGCV